MENKAYILEKIRSDNSFGEFNSEELEKRLDRELAKPDPDYDLADELTAAILEARGKAVKEIDVQSEIRVIKQKADTGIKRFRCPKWAAAASAACLVFIAANTVSAAAWGTNIVSAIIEFTKGGFLVTFDEKDSVELPTSEGDPFGIIAECAKYDIFPETPHYLPDKFVLDSVETNINEEYANAVSFRFINGDKSICMEFIRYWGELGQIGLPSDDFNISEIEVNGCPAIVSKEDNQYTITYQTDKTVFFMFTQDVPYDECEKIVESIK